MKKVIDNLMQHKNTMTLFSVGRMLEIVCYYLLPISLLISLLIVPSESMKAYGILLGQGSLILFVGIMFVKPISRFFPKIRVLMRIVSWRKELGIAVFYLAFFHTIFMVISTGILSRINEWFGDFTDPAFYGSLSLIILFALYITSNNFSIHTMKQNWKKLHYLAYPALLFALLHKFGVGDNTFVPAFVVFAIFVVLKVLEFQKSKRLRRKSTK